MDEIKVSVIIPVYMVEEYLPECLDSVLSQTLKEIEVICIDDASKDSSPAILDDYAAKDERTRVVHLTTNGQQGHARNLGISLSKGRYIYFLDSDDMITGNALQDLFETAEDRSLDGILFDAKTHYQTEELKKKYLSLDRLRNGEYPLPVYSGPELFAQLIRNDDFYVYVQRQFWNRDFLLREGLRFPEGLEHEDETFSFEAVLSAERICYLPEGYFIHRIRERSVMTTTITPKKFYGYFDAYERMVRFVSERGLQGYEISVNIGRMYEHVIRYYEILADKWDLRSYCSDPVLLHLFNLLDHSYKSKAFYQQSIRTVKALPERYNRFYIYGAGQIGRKIYQGMLNEGYVVNGFIVTDRSSNPTVLYAHPVYEIGEIDHLNENEIIIISLTSGVRKEIEAMLDEKGLRHVFYQDLAEAKEMK